MSCSGKSREDLNLYSDEDIAHCAQPVIDESTIKLVDAVLRSGSLSQGKKTELFEREFSRFLHIDTQSVAVNSGTSALYTGLISCGVGPGDEIICPSFTFAGSVNSILMTGAKPIFCDIDPYSYCIDPRKVEELVTKNTVGIMAVHLFGNSADMTTLAGIAAEHDIKLYEDCAQAQGTTWDGKSVGSLGDFGAFSFYPTKNMTTCEGGMISSRDEAVLEHSRLFRNQGMKSRYQHLIIGLNLRISEVHAAVGLGQLELLPSFNNKRINFAEHLSEVLGDFSPFVSDSARHTFHQFTVLVDDRDEVVNTIRREYGVNCGVYYSSPIHRMPIYESNASLPHTEFVSDHCISIPVHPHLTEEQRERVSEATKFCAKVGVAPK